MGREIEVKLRIADPAATRAQILAAGGKPVGEVFEDNRILDRDDRSLLKSDRGLRVRIERPIDDSGDVTATLTFKGPREAGPLKSREELEVRLSDGAVTMRLLERLGFREVIQYEKRRETLRVARCTVVIDELPRLGAFVEIEGPDESAVQQVRQRIGLQDAPVEPDTYVHLAAAKGTPDPSGVRRLVFQPGSSSSDPSRDRGSNGSGS